MSSSIPGIPLFIGESRGLHRSRTRARIGVPMPRGMYTDHSDLGVFDLQGNQLPFQGRVLARWPDGSIRWLLSDILCAVDAGARLPCYMRPVSPGVDPPVASGPVMRMLEREDSFEVDTGAARFALGRSGTRLLCAVERNGESLLGSDGISCPLLDASGHRLLATISESSVEEQGPVVVVVRQSGRFSGDGIVAPVEFTARMTFVAGVAGLTLEFKLWNPQAALHAGGLWDLGDPGSFLFADLSVRCALRPGSGVIEWQPDGGEPVRESVAVCWSIYQDSSGGANWNSPNHVDRNGELAVTFRGYRVAEGAAGHMIEVHHGLRASPVVRLRGQRGWAALAIRDFWQSFPKAVRRDADVLEAALFPRESVAGFELQGGEQKRHEIHLDFGLEGEPGVVEDSMFPVEVAVDPNWIESTKALPWFTAPSGDDDPRVSRYVAQIIEGELSFALRREIIDEYGWRNHGELYADHEAVNHAGPLPFVSHYNNQYDFIYASCLHFQRTGDARWRDLMHDAARHCMDIDIYRTREDRAAFNGGMFWHTDHHLPAATSTHRTYSRRNAEGRSYGGGPANEHNYASGLLYYHYLTGDPEAAQAVRVLADWVIAMDDGRRTAQRWLDCGPTGLASCTVEPDYHGPGRGAGNSINTLLDAFALDAGRQFLEKAEQLIRRCIHPRDDIAALGLDEPEQRWSYLVFLQALGKYLHVKRSMSEQDDMYHHARDSLRHYAAWMLAHEVPYKDVLHKVKLPTETWSAHDVRKSHVLHMAAEHSTGADREQFAARAAYFQQRCISDLLEFPTSWLTRPLVLLAVYGTIHQYYQRHGYGPEPADLMPRHYQAPERFRSQRQRISAMPAGRLLLIATEVPRVLREKLAQVGHRRRQSRAQ